MAFYRRLLKPPTGKKLKTPGDVAVDFFSSTGHTIGPWDTKLQHGGPPAALLMNCVEKMAREKKVPKVAQVNLALFRPVPVADVKVETRVVKEGNLVSHIESSIYHLQSEKELVRMRAVCLREEAISDVPEPPEEVAALERAVPPFPGKAYTFPIAPSHSQLPETYMKAVDLTVAKGVHGEGPTTMWMKVKPATIDESGATTSRSSAEGPAPKSGDPQLSSGPLQKLMAAVDSVGGLSFYVDFMTHSFLNPDLTVNIIRPPKGEDIAMEATTVLHPSTGGGVAMCRLYDREGLVAIGSATLVLQSRL